MRQQIFLTGLLMMLVTGPVHAGRLDDFEKAATQQHTSTKSGQNSDEDGDGDCSGFFSCLLQALLNSPPSSADTTSGSDYSSDDGSPADTPDRGTPTLGTEADIAYESVGPGIKAYDLYLSGKLGLFDVEGRATRFMESSPPDTLDNYQVSLIYPIRLMPSMALGAGVGLYQLAGNNINTGLSFSLPFIIRLPGTRWRMALTPVQANINGNTIADMDVRATYQIRHLNLSIGVRSIRAGGQVLEGPYAGIGYSFD